jgi:hypothetical protein
MGPQTLRERNRFPDLVDVVTVQDDVERKGQTELANPSGCNQLGIEAIVPSDAIATVGVYALKTELNCIEARSLERYEPLAGKWHTTRDEIRIKSEAVRAGDESFEVASRERFAAGQVQLNDPELLRAGKHTQPLRGVELSRVGGMIDRVRAVWTVQRASIRQLGYERVRPRGACSRHTV